MFDPRGVACLQPRREPIRPLQGRGRFLSCFLERGIPSEFVLIFSHDHCS